MNVFSVFYLLASKAFKLILSLLLAIEGTIGGCFDFAFIMLDMDYVAPAPVFSTGYKTEDDVTVNGDFYVSTNGNDANIGTKDAPFLTLEKAVEAVRNTDKTEKNGITVCIEGGEYRVSSLTFTKEDSGTAECPITYCSYDGEVILNGGKNLEPFVFNAVTDESVLARLSDDAKKNVLCTDLTKFGLNADDWGKLYPVGKYGTQANYDGDTEGPVPCNLYFNGNPLTTARYPNDGFLNTVEIIREGEGEESSTSNHQKVDGWADLRNPETTIFTVDEDTAERLNSYESLENVWLWTALIYEWADTTVPLKSFDYAARTLEPAYVSKYGAVPGSTYYIFNVIEELDAAGEWYLDRENGILYIYPPEEIDGAKITISLSTEDMITVDGAEHLIFDGLTVSGTRGNGMVIKSNNVTVKNCLISEISGNGVMVDGYYNKVTDCEFAHIGATAVEIRGGDFETLTPGENRVENCLIHDFSEVSITEGQGVNLGGVGNVCAHNEIYNAPQQAIWYGGNSNLIEYNNIHHVALLSHDTGAIYTGRRWDEVGTVIRYNAIWNIGGNGYNPHGIYFDDGTSGQTAYGNLILNSGGYGFLIGGGRNHNVSNNLIINCSTAIVYDDRSRRTLVEPDYWFEHSHEGYDMHRNLLVSPWKSEAWQTAYPYMSEWSLDYSDVENPDFIANPTGSKIVGNVVVNRKGNIGRIEESVYKYSDISGNDVYLLGVINNVFEDIDAGNYEVKNIEKIRKTIPDFENIPFDKIGRMN
ncbi:MAG: right-handed parallel beta-helix repeat-containing protein [Clostridia bacterium]|nr:right-handed parallel beta-helix repeat-containing protein [Clostridia bacterium]